ncbi:DUF2218 domain-containing protein [Streptomyces sp. RB6PN25]|uniref:DUF2218 domain-containing protein n=1 Tax=Streptomyces humicola TaxID=2953240 RepID=A0ABT1Q008_9ACTN|nr:DUF2218 domain-containing protein [Streptomyces humicola]MCQ4082102.1 DUF2218 domain-containing protein [Streptomyces humicola]
MPRSQARVVTDRPHRYAKQLASHLGRRIQTEWSEETGAGRLDFPFGTGTMTAEPGALLLTVEGDAARLERLEDVVGRHLVRFGTKDELLVEWHRDNGEPGLIQRNDADA